MAVVPIRSFYISGPYLPRYTDYTFYLKLSPVSIDTLDRSVLIWGQFITATFSIESLRPKVIHSFIEDRRMVSGARLKFRSCVCRLGTIRSSHWLQTGDSHDYIRLETLNI